MMFKLSKHKEDQDSVKVEYPENVMVEDKLENMSWEEIEEGFETLRLVAEFEKIYGKCPTVHRFWGMRKAKKWIHEYNIFKEGAKVAEKWTVEWIKNSGWLKEDVQKELEREEKEEED